MNKHLILPLGTHVTLRHPATTGAGVLIAPAGAVGHVVRAPDDASHSYRVRLPGGAEVSVRREHLTIRKQEHAAALHKAGGMVDEADMYAHVALRCVVGSRAYGLQSSASDVDLRGFYLPPARLHWALYGVPEQLESADSDEVYWEAGKFLVLALKANPNVLECLYTPLVRDATAIGQELLDNRHRFLSRRVYQTFNGYVISQFKRLETDFRMDGAPRWKHAMHLIRLLLSGIGALREGALPVAVEDEHRAALLDVRAGSAPWDEVNQWRLALHRDFDAAYAATALPEAPDYDWANDFLVRARRSAVEG
ncbi:DNA polymerase beta superfamily protein [Longimicrobium terrae]|uniref:Nucleotidyltransferase n=1 Tax=Longimicrobium terrae TaxID=1639882 RepID=A0A841H138_9BACT|nr:hypothetical protein [Longimicrobium terrae]MBB6071791.1 hypothetical protein [Longimicrobium terrae]NNC28551.1 nucleotidyltransferase domain-containing protein [Longimicrobium terrae]